MKVVGQSDISSLQGGSTVDEDEVALTRGFQSPLDDNNYQAKRKIPDISAISSEVRNEKPFVKYV